MDADPLAREAVVARLDALFGDWGNEQAIEFVDQSAPQERRWWTWRDVGAARDALSVALGDLAEGTAVALVMRQRPAMVACELAVLSLGRAALLINPLSGDQTLAVDVAQLGAAVVVAHPLDWARPGFADAVTASGSLGIEIDDDGGVTVMIAVAELVPGPAIDAAVTVQTSGTTGPPKRLPVGWDTFCRLGGGPHGREPRSGKGALILSLPLVTLGGLLSMARLVFMGRPMAMLERFDVRAWAELVKEHRPTVIGAPPPVVQMILDADITADHFDGVGAYVTSSAAIPAETIRRFEQRYGIPVLLGYGATEFLNSVTGWTSELWTEFGVAKVGSVGRALSGVRLRVVDDDSGAEAAADQEGILEVDPPQRAGHLPAGWLRTADRARIDDDGFVWIIGRADDVIIRGGFKVELASIESALRDHPGVADAAAVGLADDRLGQVPGAMVVSAKEGSLTTRELQDWLRARLAVYAVPTVIRIVETLPRTATFKPHRVEIARQLSQLLGEAPRS